MKKFCLFLSFSILLLSGCQKKPVQLPLLNIAGLSEIQNHSSIWIFMESREGENVARLNKNNKIINTDWIFNIDRRLSMGQIIPILIDMQENRNKDSMHKKEGMKNYFSYADTTSEKISLVLFPQTDFILGQKEMSKGSTEPCVAIIEIWGEELKLNGEILSFDAILSFLENDLSCESDEMKKIILSYEDRTSYQDYLKVKTLLHSKQINCSPEEYVYTVK